MPIEFKCAKCQSTLRVADENAGKMARCPTCQMIVPIPGNGDMDATTAFDRGEPVAPSPPPPQPTRTRWLLRTPDGSIYGPVAMSELQSWLAEGRVTEDCYLQEAGQSSWTPAGKVMPEIGKPKSHITDAGAPAAGTAGTAYASHNATAVIVLGCLGLFFFPLAIAALIIGAGELKAMDRGTTDPSGRSNVTLGMTLAAVFLLMNLFGGCCCCMVPSVNVGDIGDLV